MRGNCEVFTVLRAATQHGVPNWPRFGSEEFPNGVCLVGYTFFVLGEWMVNEISTERKGVCSQNLFEGDGG